MEDDAKEPAAPLTGLRVDRPLERCLDAKVADVLEASSRWRKRNLQRPARQ